MTSYITAVRYGIANKVFSPMKTTSYATSIDVIFTSQHLETEWVWSKPQEPSVTRVIKEHSVMCSAVATSPSHSSSHPPPLACRTRGGLPSAARGCHVNARALGGIHSGEDFGACGVNANGGVEVGLGGSQPHGQAVALGDLSSIRGKQMEPYHTLLSEGGVWSVPISGLFAIRGLCG